MNLPFRHPVLMAVCWLVMLIPAVFITPFSKASPIEGIAPVSPKQVVSILPSAHDQPVIVMFKSKFCQDCKTLRPLLEQRLSKADAAGISLILFDILVDRSKYPQVFQAFRPTTVPTVIYIRRGGHIQESFVGLKTPQQLERSLQKLLLSSIQRRKTPLGRSS
ncbi:MAG: thioredoxin family protein [Vampirovibrionales bacterium]|nr:thioredoxin family protein [Vampirovibrionales bacterium]